ncbi:MAG: hypothetical protein IIT39_01310 [Clostridia bacterium]|nr:hypothetical protein [Clostridia bacterium]
MSIFNSSTVKGCTAFIGTRVQSVQLRQFRQPFIKDGNFLCRQGVVR